MLWKAKASAYKKALGKDPGETQLKQILYVCMDTNSKNLASQSQLDQKSYQAIAEDIDLKLLAHK